MGFVDSDAHVDESEQTWEYMNEAEARYRPVSLDAGGKGFLARDPRPHRVWLIAGTAWLRRFRDDKVTGTTRATRELEDVESRLRHMDELGIDFQVIYPTTFIYTVTDQPHVEAAVHGSYNRWLADRTAASGGRLRWVYVPPVLSMDRAVAEMEWAKEHGACGVMKKGVEYNRTASDPSFFPLYEKAQRLDLPICFHLGGGTIPSNTGDVALMARQCITAAFESLTQDRVPDRFPELKFGFIEAGASWIPYMMKEMGMRGRAGKYPYDFKSEFLKRNRFYVTCDTEDDLSHILQFGAEDQLMIGTDYSHADQSAELRAHRTLVERSERGVLSPGVLQKIVSDNARAFYAL